MTKNRGSKPLSKSTSQTATLCQRQGEVTQYLGEYKEAQHFAKDNQHICQGYRIGFESPQRIVKSLFMLHNETGNIWTHLIGFIIVFFIIFEGIAYEMQQSHVLAKQIIKEYALPPQYLTTSLRYNDTELLCQMLSDDDLKEGQPQFQCHSLNSTRKNQKSQNQIPLSNEVATWPVMIMLAGGAICLACSAVFHLIYQMNQKIFKISSSLDFAGIGINMSFSPIPCFYYSLYCHERTATIYITLVFLAGAGTFATQLIDWFKKKENFIYRTSVFLFSTFICLVGLTHLLINQFVYGNYGDPYTVVPSLIFFIGAIICYGVGFIFYARKCPERYKPGKFDYCGHSHQIWHVLVFMGIIFTYIGSLACYEMRSRWAVCPATDLFM